MSDADEAVMQTTGLEADELGKALAKSLAGDTTLAAMLTASVATTTVNMAMPTTSGA